MKILSALIFAFFVSYGSGSNNTETNDDGTPIQYEDSEGRKYNEADRISDECHEAYCCDGGCKDATICYLC